MITKPITPSIVLLIHYSKYFPKNIYLKYIMFLLKIIPIIILTHDWNISYGQGLSYWLRNISLITFFTYFQVKALYQFIIVLIFIIEIGNLCMFFYLKRELIKYGKLFTYHKQMIKIMTYFLFIPFSFLNHYIFSIYVEAFFCPSQPIPESHGIIMKEISPCQDVSYIIIGIGIGFNVLFSLGNCIIISLLAFEPFFAADDIMMNELGKIDIISLIVPFIQAIIQLEYHLNFRIMLIIKHLLRTFFMGYYFISFIRHYTFFTKYYLDYIHRFILSMCFISCLIEWMFSIDPHNDFILLIEDTGIIILKICLELFGAKCLVSLYYKTERNKINNFIMNHSSLKKSNFHAMLLKLCINLYQSYDVDSVTLFTTSILQRCTDQISLMNTKNGNENQGPFHENFITNFKPELYQEQQEKYLSIITDKEKSFRNKGRLLLKEFFPLLFNYLYNMINSSIGQVKSTKSQSYLNALFILLTFELIFEKNIVKCLLSVEKIKQTHLYKKNKFFCIQIHLMQAKLIRYFKETHKHYYQSQQSKKGQFKDQYPLMHMSFKSLLIVSSIEEMTRDCLKEYISIMNSFNEEEVTYNDFIKLLINFNDKYTITTKKCISSLKSSQCSIPYSSKKFELFYSYFQEVPPKEIESSFDFFFKRNTIMTTNDPYSIIVFNVDLINEHFHFSIDYASDEIIGKLNLTFEHFHSMTFDDLFPPNFVRAYHYLFEDIITKGKALMSMSNFCLLDKDKFVLLFNLIGIPVYAFNHIKIFLKVIEVKEETIVQNQQKRIKLSNANASKPKKMVSLNKLEFDTKNFYGNCFIFTSKRGKIMSISRAFGDFFYLTSNIIAKHRMNIKDIIKFEVLNQQGVLQKDLNSLYENIIELNSVVVGQLGEDEFSKAILLIKETQRNLIRIKANLHVIISYEKKELIKASNGKQKIYYLFVLQVFDKQVAKITPNIANISSMNDIDNTPTFNEKSSFMTHHALRSCLDQTTLYNRDESSANHNYINNRIDYQQKILVIRNLSIKLLKMYFGYDLPCENIEKYNLEKYTLGDEKKKRQSKAIINSTTPNTDATINTVNNTTGNTVVTTTTTDTNNDNTSPFAKREMGNDGSTKYSFQLKEEKELYDKIMNKSMKPTCNYVLKFSGFTIVIIVILLCAILTKKKNTETKENCEHFSLYGDLTLVFLRMTGLLSNVINMQIQANSLQNETIDNDFPNSYDYYQENLPLLLKDFLIYANRFLNYFTKNFINTDIQITARAFNETLFLAMDNNGMKTKINSTVGSFNHMALNIRQILYSEPLRIYYNRSDYYVEEVTDYYSQFQFIYLIENLMPIYKYTHADIMISFAKYYLYHKFEMIKLINIGLLTQTLIYVGILYFCLVLFIRTKISLFAKYFANYTQLRFFNVFILKKTQVVLEYIMNNSSVNYDTMKNIKEFIGNVGLVNDKQVFRDIKTLMCDPMNKISDIRVNAFKVKVQTPTGNIANLNQTLRYPGTSFMIRQTEISEISPKSYLASLNSKTIIRQDHSEFFQIKPASKGSRKKPVSKMESMKKQKIKKAQFNDQSSMNTLATSSSNKVMLSNLNNNTHLIAPNISSISSLKGTVHNGGKRLLDKQFNSHILILSITILAIALISLDIIDLVLSNQMSTVLKSIFETQNYVFRRIELVSNLFLIYQTILLKNEILISNYKSQENITYCSEGNYINDLTKHNIFDEMLVCLPKMREGVENITQGQNINYYLEKTMEYQKRLDSSDFCEFYATFFSEHEEIIQLIGLINIDSHDELKDSCERIGSGFNSQGMSMALNSMETTLKSLYIDFINDKDRNELSNYERMNNKKFLMLQVEYYHIIQNLPFIYLISFREDYTIIQNKEIEKANSLLVAKIIMILIITLYYIHQVFHFAKEEQLINFFNKSVLNTIIY